MSASEPRASSTHTPGTAAKCAPSRGPLSRVAGQLKPPRSEPRSRGAPRKRSISGPQRRPRSPPRRQPPPSPSPSQLVESAPGAGDEWERVRRPATWRHTLDRTRRVGARAGRSLPTLSGTAPHQSGACGQYLADFPRLGGEGERRPRRRSHAQLRTLPCSS